jgi:hypothetical protein
MAGKSKIVTGALEGLSDLASKFLPDNILELPSVKEATRAYKKAFEDENEGRKFGEFKYDDKYLDNEVDFPVSHIRSPMGDLNLFADDPGGNALQKWYDGEISVESPEFNFAAGFDDEIGDSAIRYLPQPSSNFNLDPLGYVLRDLEMNYDMTKDEIIDYIGKQKVKGDDGEIYDALPRSFTKHSADISDLETQMLKDAFASGDSNNPIVKRVRGALDDLADEDDLVEVTPDMIYGKIN